MSVVSVVVTRNPSKVELGVRFPYNAIPPLEKVEPNPNKSYWVSLAQPLKKLPF